MKRKCMWLVITQVLEMASAMFFHDQPIVINREDADKDTYLGYSLSYQKDLNTLVVGAPNDETGKVFTCSLNLDSSYSSFKPCTRFDKLHDAVNGLPNTKRCAKDYKFMMGASVAALPNSSFVACAPMWSGEISQEFFVWGSCFEVKNNGDIHALNGLYGPERDRKFMKGCFGMRTVADDVNDLILISKPASPPANGDIAFIKQSSPLDSMKSMIESENRAVNQTSKNVIKIKLASYRNLGIAMATGNFFKKNINEKTFYAIGLTDNYADGEVIFLRLTSNNKLTIKNSKSNIILQIKDDIMYSMLGASLCSTDLDSDEFTDLIVGAPALPAANQMEAEYGAVHIYLGSYDADDFVQRKLTIMGKKEGSRFGSTIAAHDLDSDGLPEIFISALYENEGVLYILSGYEMKEKLDQSQPRPIINVVDFKSSQEIRKEDFRLLGFSIMPVSDLDNNGCDELAVGAPGSDKIVVLRCIPTITINVTADLMEYKIIPETTNKFKVLVCINLNYQSKTEKIAANVEMLNTFDDTGIVTIDKSDKTFYFDISKKTPKYCRNVSVTIADNLPGTYKFQTRAKLINNDFSKTTFDRSWVRNSSYSILSKFLIIQRACSGKECEYNMTMDLKWSGGELKEKEVPAAKYAVGSRDENVTVQISNWGRPAYEACILIKVEHAPVSKLDCKDIPEGYLCMLPAGFMPMETRDIDIQLKTSKLTDEYRSFQVNAVLYNECDKKYINQTQEIIVDYEFNADELLVNGTSNTRSITEKSMKSVAETIDVVHTYMIENKGSVLWKNVVIDVVDQEMKDFMKDLKVHSEKCSLARSKANSCTMDLEPSSLNKVVVTVSLKKKEIEKSLMENKLKVITELTLRLKSVTISKHERVVALLVYQKDSSLGHNKSLIVLIAIIVAIIIIAIVIIILYKVGFFKRKQKEKLQEEIRRRSVRKSNANSDRQDSLLEIMEEDVDDDAFHCDDPTTNAAGKSSNRSSARASKLSTTKDTKKQEGSVKVKD